MQQINPVLIQALTRKDQTEIPESPAVSMLPGNYAKMINKRKNAIKSIFPINYFMIKCKSCRRQGKYNVGMMVINTGKKAKKETGQDNIQTTGYFRCKHCNEAGNWEMPHDFLMKAMAALFQNDLQIESETCKIGENRLYDGSRHQYCSDAEEHLLHKLSEEPNNSFLWNRLGNLYEKGNRPELAAAVFEYSLSIDPLQTESHFSLGSLFIQINELEKSASHFKQMLLTAESYQSIPAAVLRNILANGLSDLFYIHQRTGGIISFLPAREELEMAGKISSAVESNASMDFELFSDQLESFYPVAEMYMGDLAKKIPFRDRRLKKQNSVKKKKKRKKRK